MAIPSGIELYEFSTSFWDVCVNIQNWKKDDLFILSKIPTDKLQMISKFDKSYSKKKDEKPIFLTDNSFLLIKKGSLFSTHHFYGQIDKPFQYFLLEIDSISVNALIDTPEFGNVYVNENLIGKLSTNLLCVVALKEFFRKFIENDLSIDAHKIHCILDPAVASLFLMSLSKLNVSYKLLSAIRDDAIDKEEIYKSYDPLILTNFRVIATYNNTYIKYEAISHVSAISFVEHPEYTHAHTPEGWGWQIKAFVGLASMINDWDKKETTMYQANFFVDNKIEIAVKSPHIEYVLNLLEALKIFNVKTIANF